MHKSDSSKIRYRYLHDKDPIDASFKGYITIITPARGTGWAIGN